MIFNSRRFRTVCSLSLAAAMTVMGGLPVSAAAAGAGGAGGAVESAPFSSIVSWTGDTATEMTVSWRDNVKQDEVLQVVEKAAFDKSGFDGAAVFRAKCKDVSLEGEGVWRYEADAAGLKPGTEYVYRAGGAGTAGAGSGSESAGDQGSGASWTEPESFRTDNPEAKDYTFAYMGDIQTDHDAEEENRLWGELAQRMYEQNPDIGFTMLGGDIVESGISIPLYESFMKNASPVFSKIPLMATNGNHESNFPGGKPELYLDYFALPHNSPEGFNEEFYSFDVANCHIIVLNSWIFSGEQNLTDADYERVDRWIKNDLAKSDADWQIAVTHVPTYAVHNDTTSLVVKEKWAPIFEHYGLDLMLEGHQHVYRRSSPMYDGKINPEKGLTYVMGNAGKKFYNSGDDTFSEKLVAKVTNYQIIKTTDRLMTVTSYDDSGNEMDFVEISKREPDITRLQYIDALWKGAGAPEPAAPSPFKDTKDKAAAWAYETGIILGCGNGIFDPDSAIAPWQRDLILERTGA